MSRGRRIRQAREIRGLTQSELAKAIGKDQSHISLLEQDAREPSDVVLQAIALQTRFPVAFFRQEKGPEFPLGSLLYRRRQSLSSEDRDRVRQLAGLTFEITDKMARHYAPLEVNLPTNLPEPLIAARVTRTALGLSPDLPITHLVHLLEKHGVYVLALPVEVPGHDAFSTWMDSSPRRPVIVITRTHAGDRLRFSVAHELGHLVLHRTPKGLARIENEADRFAAEFLVPADAIKSEMNLPLTLTALAVLKARWGVSMQTLVTRARHVGLITESQRRYLFQQISARGWRKKEPVAVPLERPRLIRKLAETLHGLSFESAQVASHVGAPARLVHDILSVHLDKDGLASDSQPASRTASARDGEVIAFTSAKRTDQG